MQGCRWQCILGRKSHIETGEIITIWESQKEDQGNLDSHKSLPHPKQSNLSFQQEHKDSSWTSIVLSRGPSTELTQISKHKGNNETADSGWVDAGRTSELRRQGVGFGCQIKPFSPPLLIPDTLRPTTFIDPWIHRQGPPSSPRHWLPVTCIAITGVNKLWRSHPG